MDLVALRARTGSAPQQYHLGKMNAQRLQRGEIENQMAQHQKVKSAMDMFGSVALGAMGGKLDGEVDPQRYEQGIEWLASQGMDVSSLQGKPELAPVLARGSLGVLQAMNANKSDEEMQLRLRQFDMQMTQAAAQLEAMRQRNERDNTRFNWEQEDRNKVDVPKPEPGFRWTDETYTEQVPIAGGSADPEYIRKVNESKAAGKPQKYTQLTSQAQKQLVEADDAVRSSVNTVASMTEALRLNKEAYEGFAADTRGKFSAYLGGEGGKATLDLDNLIKGGALENLKATFGGMPTEGERKILIEIQGSSDQPAEVRERIYTRAIAAAMAREAYNKRKAAALRDGSFYAEGFDPNPEPFDKYLPMAKQIADQQMGRKPVVEDVTDKDQSRVVSSGSQSKVISYKDYFE